MKRLTRALLILSMAAAPSGRPSAVHAQDPPRPAPPVVPGGVELVRVDVIVTDHDGRHIGSLRAEDFAIEEDGEPRTIANLRYVTTGEAAGVPAPTATVPPPAAEGESSSSTPDEPAASGARSLVIVVDDVTFSAESRVRVPRMIGHLIDDLAGPDTPLLLMRTGGGKASLQDFTIDRALQKAVLAHIRASPAGIGGLRGDRAEGITLGVDWTLRTLRSTQVLMDQLGSRPGRKTLLLVTEGMRGTSGGDEADPRVLDALRRLTDSANRGGVTISTIDPSGLQTERLMADYFFDQTPAGGSTTGMDSAALRQKLSQQPARASKTRLELRFGPEQLSRDTGGLSIFDSNDLKGSAERVWNDQDGYYLLGYEPDAGSVPRPGDPPVEHEVSVRVKRPGLVVRARRVYYAQAAPARP